MDEVDLGRRLAESASSLVPPSAVDPAGVAGRAIKAHRRRRRARTGLVAASVLVGAVVGVDHLATHDVEVSTTADEPAEAGWERLPDPPLEPRTSATAVWTGSEVIVMGGRATSCSSAPSTDCLPEVDALPLSDGAAFDPATNRWRSIANAPEGFSSERAAILDGDVYVLAPCYSCRDVFPPPALLLRYDPETDEWTTLDSPPAGIDHDLTATGRWVVSYSPSDEAVHVPDFAFDTAARSWRELPDDPEPDASQRSMISAGDDSLVLTQIPNSRYTGQPETTNVAATFSFATGSWSALPASPGHGSRILAADEAVLLQPSYGTGGLLDLTTRVWSELPAAPAADGWENEIAGVLGPAQATYVSPFGWILDVDRDEWSWLDAPPDYSTPDVAQTSATGQPETDDGLVLYDGPAIVGREDAIVAVDRDLFLFGESPSGTAAWIWRPPPVGSDAPTSSASTASTATSSSPSSTTPSDQQGRLLVELADTPHFIEGFDLAVRIKPTGSEMTELRAEDFVVAESANLLTRSASASVEVPSGSVLVQAHITIGQGPGPREPDFINTGDGYLCSPVEVIVPPDGEATAYVDWQTGCLESDAAPDPAPSELLPDRAPDATGVIEGPYPADQTRVLVVSTGQPSDFDRARLRFDNSNLVSGMTGEELGISDIVDGTRVEVWFEGCEESIPAHCWVTALRTR